MRYFGFKAGLWFCVVLLLFLPLVMGNTQQFTKHIIDGNLDWASGVATADVDDDLDIDVVATGASANEVAWYENDGDQNFTKHLVDTLGSPRSCYGVDLDLDTDVDIIVAADDADRIVWYENDGSQNFTEHLIVANLSSAWDVFVVDLDVDNDLDVVATAAFANVVNWYENNGSQNFTEHTIDSFLDGAEGIFVIDLDKDNDLDVVATGIFGDEVVWYENDSTQGFTEYIVDAAFDGANDVFVDDMDMDGDLDLVASASQHHQIAWYENDGMQNFTKHVVAPLQGARAVFVAHLNADTLPDIAAVGLLDMVMWYENTGAGNFIPHVIDNFLDLAFGLYVADLDSDSDLDVLATGGAADDLAWYESDLVGISEGSLATRPELGGVRVSNHPNPFRHSTTISYELANPSWVVLRVYDIKGQLLRTLVNGLETSGRKAVPWERCDAQGNRVPSGVYFYMLETNASELTGRIIVVD